MRVIKRDGQPQDVDFNRVARRNMNLARPDTSQDPKSGTPDLKVNIVTRQLAPLTAVDPNMISKEVIRDIHDGVTTVELDVHSAKIAQALCTYHPQYGQLAGRIYISNFHKNNIYDLAKNEFKTSVPTDEQRQFIEDNLFLKTAEALWNNTDKSGKQAPLIAPRVYRIIQQNAQRLEELLEYTRDFNFDFLGMTMMEKKYLLSANLFNGKKMHRVPIERPQHMFMRVAIGVHCSGEFVPYNSDSETDFALFEEAIKEVGVELTKEEMYKLFTALLPFLKFPDRDTRVDWSTYDLNQHDGVITNEQWEKIVRTYNIMSQGEAVHATPTLFNAGTLRPQCSSCFLVMLPSDSLEGIARFFTILMHIQKGAGGIGSSIHNLRPAGSYIRGTNGTSNGITPFAKVVNAISIYIDQGGNKRPGSHAVYLGPWHADMPSFLELRRPRGNEHERARELFYGFWNNDEFMWRVENDTDWWLLCPDQCPEILGKFNAKASETFVDDHTVLENSVDYAFSHTYRQYVREGKFVKKIKAREIWDAVMELQTEQGMPYMLHSGNVNRKNNQANLGSIEQSNLCVAPDTIILTKSGQKVISTLENQQVEVWNGKEWSMVTVMKTGTNKKLWKVEFSDGASLKCTKYHKFHIQEGYWGKSVVKQTNELEEGMKLIKFHLPKPHTLSSNDEFPHPYTHGAFCADGTYSNKQEESWRCEYQSLPEMSYCARHKGYQSDDSLSEKCQAMIGNAPMISLYDYKKDLIQYLDIYSSSYQEDAQGRINVQLVRTLRPKFEVPLNANEETKLSWLEGYLDFDGTVAKNGTNLSLQAASIYKEFLFEIKLMLQTLGVDSKVTLSQKARNRSLPDGKGGSKQYYCQDLYRLLISNANLNKLIKLGFCPKRLNLDDFELGNRDAGQFVKIVSVTETDEFSDVYCFNEPKRHMGVFNGVIAGNCTEIVEFTSADEVAVCNLASICLPSFVEDGEGTFTYECSLKPDESRRRHFNMDRFKSVVKHMTKNLDSVIDTNYYPVEEAKRSNMRHRPIGLGVQGLADLFAILRVPFDSQEAIRLNYYIFEALYFAALDASNEMAQEKGSYETFQGSPASKGILQFDLVEQEGLARATEQVGGATINIFFERKQDWNSLKQRIIQTGLRNSLLVAPMPTASTSYLMNNSPCFEPYNSNIYKRANDVGEFVVVNELLINDLISLGLWNNDMKNKIMIANGSIQDIMEIPKNVRVLYKTAWDMSPKVIINLAISRSPFIDQSQSMNLFIERPSPKILTQIHFYTWRRGLKTGSYYIHSRPPVDAQKLQIADQQAVDLVKRSVRAEEPDSPNTFGDVCTMKEGCLSCGS